MANHRREARSSRSFTSTTFAPRPAAPAPDPPPTDRPPDLPGCESFHLPERDYEAYDGHLEFWDRASGTAWRVRDVSTWHERPTRRLTGLAERIASLRGSPILCVGSASLLRRDAAGRRRWVMEADEILYLHPARKPIRGSSVLIGEHPLPDVALEVDHSTDARRWKLGVYQECGFPEIWVDVPWENSVRRPGLAIHLREDGGYREAEESRAFPGWTAEQIHRALTEDPLSAASWRAIERVALAMGKREGTTPDDDPLLRSWSRRAASRGRVEGLRAARVRAVMAALHARGIDVPEDVAARDVSRRADLSLDALITAAVTCKDASDFRRRLRETG